MDQVVGGSAARQRGAERVGPQHVELDRLQIGPPGLQFEGASPSDAHGPSGGDQALDHA
jgi:hypothetical protein